MQLFLQWRCYLLWVCFRRRHFEPRLRREDSTEAESLDAEKWRSSVYEVWIRYSRCLGVEEARCFDADSFHLNKPSFPPSAMKGKQRPLNTKAWRGSDSPPEGSAEVTMLVCMRWRRDSNASSSCLWAFSWWAARWRHTHTHTHTWNAVRRWSWSGRETGSIIKLNKNPATTGLRRGGPLRGGLCRARFKTLVPMLTWFDDVTFKMSSCQTGCADVIFAVVFLIILYLYFDRFVVVLYPFISPFSLYCILKVPSC